MPVNQKFLTGSKVRIKGFTAVGRVLNFDPDEAAPYEVKWDNSLFEVNWYAEDALEAVEDAQLVAVTPDTTMTVGELKKRLELLTRQMPMQFHGCEVKSTDIANLLQTVLTGQTFKINAYVDIALSNSDTPKNERG
jgi:hypothetical protein